MMDSFRQDKSFAPYLLAALNGLPRDVYHLAVDGLKARVLLGEIDEQEAARIALGRLDIMLQESYAPQTGPAAVARILDVFAARESGRDGGVGPVAKRVVPPPPYPKIKKWECFAMGGIFMLFCDIGLMSLGCLGIVLCFLVLFPLLKPYYSDESL